MNHTLWWFLYSGKTEDRICSQISITISLQQRFVYESSVHVSTHVHVHMYKFVLVSHGCHNKLWQAHRFNTDLWTCSSLGLTWVLFEAKIQVWTGLYPFLEALGENPLPWLFQPLETCSILFAPPLKQIRLGLRGQSWITSPISRFLT